MSSKKKVAGEKKLSRLERIKIVLDMCLTTPIPMNILNQLDTDSHPEFQDWVCDHMKPELEFSTGDALINAAVDMAESRWE